MHSQPRHDAGATTTPAGETPQTPRRSHWPSLAVLRGLGAGLIAGAADTDPTTVATLAVIGATTTYGLVWLNVLIIPMLSVVQVVSASVGVVCKTGLEDAIRARFGRLWATVTLLLILAVNVLTLAADREGGCAALQLLTATSAFVMAEAFGWRRSLDVGFSRAPRFYVALVISLAVAVGITLVGVTPIRLLFLSSLVGGLGTPVTLLFLMLLSRDHRMMGEHRIGGRLATAGWVVTLIVAAACALFLWQTFL
jgi:Mn2+/Fe2+ NRAMP family transporter